MLHVVYKHISIASAHSIIQTFSTPEESLAQPTMLLACYLHIIVPRVLHFAHMREGYCSCLVCVCECFCGPHLRLVELSDKLDILVVLVSCSLVFKFGVFRIMASFRR